MDKVEPSRIWNREPMLEEVNPLGLEVGDNETKEASYEGPADGELEVHPDISLG